MNPKLSLVVPIYNDGNLAEDFCIEFSKVFQSYFNTEYINSQIELIFVNDGSKDQSIEYLQVLISKFNFVKVIDLSRNFGQHIALTAGYDNASGDFVGMMNVDQQEHPSELIKFLDYFSSNKEIDFVLGLRKYRKDNILNRFTSTLFTLLMNKLTGDYTPLNASTVRLMNRKFLNAYLSLNEKNRYLPGLENWLGFKHGYVNVTHIERRRGKSSYTIQKRIKMAFNAILSFSDTPLKIATGVGFTVAIIGFMMGFYLLIQKLFFINIQPGYTSTITIIVFLSGTQIMFIGLASLYIGRILREVQNRPLYIINNKYNF